MLLMRILGFSEERRRLTIPCPRVTARDELGRPIEWCGGIMEWKATRVPRFRPGVSEHIYKCPACGVLEIVIERRRPAELIPPLVYTPPWRR